MLPCSSALLAQSCGQPPAVLHPAALLPHAHLLPSPHPHCPQALHLFQEVLDLGLAWGPGITAAMVKASLDLQVGWAGRRAHLAGGGT